MHYHDLRGWLDAVNSFGELRVVEGADWNQEIGAVAEVAAQASAPPAVLFDKIKDYPAGRRVLTGIHNATLKRQCLTNHLPLDYSRDQLIHAWKKRLDRPVLIPPRLVSSAPVLENVFEGKEIDILSLPIPWWHQGDGGRYVGSLDATISRDLDDGWINVGCYRVMVHDRDTLALYISPGHHGHIHRQKYFDRGRPFPVAISFGPDPLLWFFGQMEIPTGQSEYDYAGGVRGAPYEVILGEHTGLPIPAACEVAIEGEVIPGTQVPEGPFGEFTGYYAGGLRSEPMLKVKRLMYRNDPIITGAPPFKPAPGAENNLIRAAYIWNYLEKAGVPDVRGVAYYQTRMFVVVAITQRYPGHARQAALVASQCRAAALLTRYVMVVDDDIDIWDSNDILWALCTRTDPAKDIDVLRRCWSNPIDPIIPPSERGFQSRGIIDACRPYEWMQGFPKVSGASAELKAQVTEKFGASLAAKSNKTQ
jgi:4-hydroxy-3-polyprenylbenzoate decarboxylase